MTRRRLLRRQRRTDAATRRYGDTAFFPPYDERENANSLLLPDIPEKTRNLGRQCMALFAPPPDIKISEWAERNRILPESSPHPGRWHNSTAPFLVEPMDACCTPGVRQVTLMFPSQDGKTEIMLNVNGYYIDHDPSAIMYVRPSKEDAQDFSKERLAPMLEDCPALAEKVAEPKSRESSNTILHKKFPGGFVVLVGANTPTGLAGWPIRILEADEVDRFPVSVGSSGKESKEGDPLSLAEKRTTRFWNALIVISSTPTTKGESRIESEYAKSSQGKWCVACPSCGEFQPYSWRRLLFDSVEMICEHCGVAHSEYEWKESEHKWIHAKDNPFHLGFHKNALGSPWFSWSALIAEFKEAQKEGPDVFKTWINTRLAEPWEEKGESADADALESKRHKYNCDVPAEVILLTAGVDVQADRLEMEVVGWGPGTESWGIQYVVLIGSPHKQTVWKELDGYLNGTYKTADGRNIGIRCTCIDSGYATSVVYAFCLKRMHKYVFAVKGKGGPGQPEVGAYSKQGKNKNVPVFPVGTDSSKDTLLSRLQVEEAGPGYCHFPTEELLSEGSPRGYDETYFKGLQSEKRVPRKKDGRPYHAWVKKTSSVRNEALDTRVYASSALRIVNPKLEAPTSDSKSGESKPFTGGKKPRTGRRVLSRGVVA